MKLAYVENGLKIKGKGFLVDLYLPFSFFIATITIILSCNWGNSYFLSLLSCNWGMRPFDELYLPFYSFNIECQVQIDLLI